MQTDAPEKNDTKVPKNKGFIKSVCARINGYRQHLAVTALFAGMLLFIIVSGNGYEKQQTVRYIEPLTPEIVGDSSENSESLSDSEISDDTTQYPLDINKATYSQLCGIKGIGGKTAGAIINFRSEHGYITSLEQLTEISGFGDKTVKQLSKYLYVSDDRYIPYTAQTVKTTKPAKTTVPQTKPEKTTQEKTITRRTKVETEPPQTSPPETESSQFPEQDPEPTRRPVNINLASAEEIADCLLLTLEKAQDIVAVREQIGHFSDVNELFLVDSLTEEDIAEIVEFVEI